LLLQTQALIHGLNRHYYSIAINYRKDELEQKMLLNVHKPKWTDGLLLEEWEEHNKQNEAIVKEMLNLAKAYNKSIQDEINIPPEKLAIQNVGKVDPKKHLESDVEKLMAKNATQLLGAMLDTVVF
jgi:26S proteasome regulatory subunit N11